jgi:hypothetical protein
VRESPPTHSFAKVSPVGSTRDAGAAPKLPHRPLSNNNPVYTLPMNYRALTLVLAAGITASPVCSQSADISVAKTTVCDIVNHPSQFIGKTVEVRAQIWPDYSYSNLYWLNESSVQFGKVCRFLQASFRTKSGLGGQRAFGTFRGRIIERLSRQKSSLVAPDPKGLPVIFLVDQQSDIYLRRDYLSGPTPILQLYNQQTGSLVRPEY